MDQPALAAAVLAALAGVVAAAAAALARRDPGRDVVVVEVRARVLAAADERVVADGDLAAAAPALPVRAGQAAPALLRSLAVGGEALARPRPRLERVARARAPPARLRVDVVGRAAHGAQPEAGQQLGDEVADGREAGAEDGAVHLDHGPDCCLGAVPGRVVGEDDEVEGRGADDGDDACAR